MAWGCIGAVCGGGGFAEKGAWRAARPTTMAGLEAAWKTGRGGRPSETRGAEVAGESGNDGGQ